MSSTGRNLRVTGVPALTLRAVIALMLREMASTYGRSPGGYLWAVIEPAAGIALLTALFSIAFHNPPLGTDFALFYATGLLPYLMYARLTGKLGCCLLFSRPLLEYPRVTFVDALVARLVLNVLTFGAVHVMVIAFLILVLGVHVTFDFGAIARAYAMVIVLAAGIGTLNAYLFVAYPLWQTVWNILNQPLFLVSCVFFLFESVPRTAGDVLWFNPLVHVVGEMRAGFYPFYHPQYVAPLYVFGIGAVSAVIGLFLLNRFHGDILSK